MREIRVEVEEDYDGCDGSPTVTISVWSGGKELDYVVLDVSTVDARILSDLLALDPWGPPRTQRYGLVVNWTGRLIQVELNQATTDLTPGRRAPRDRCPLGHGPSPVPGDLRCDCGIYLYSDLT